MVKPKENTSNIINLKIFSHCFHGEIHDKILFEAAYLCNSGQMLRGMQNFKVIAIDRGIQYSQKDE